MNRIIFIAVVWALSVSCGGDTAADDVPFVSEVVMPTSVFDAGDEVTVRATGFDIDDGIMVRRADAATQMQIVLQADITHRSSDSITFIMPAGYSAGTVEVLLFRSGETMLLGSIAVSDGLPPASAVLYGLGHNASGRFVINAIDSSTGGIAAVAVVDHAMDCAVTRAGTNRMFGIERSDRGTTVSGYDFTMRRCIDVDYDTDPSGGIIGILGQSPVLLKMDDDRTIGITDCRLTTRDTAPLPPHFTATDIPEEVRSVRFKGDPFLHVANGRCVAEIVVETAGGSESLALASIDFGSRRWRIVLNTDGADDIFPVLSGDRLYMAMVSGGNTAIHEYRTDGVRAVVGEVAGKVMSCTPDHDNGRLLMLVDHNGIRTIVEFGLADGACGRLCTVPAEVEQILMVR